MSDPSYTLRDIETTPTPEDSHIGNIRARASYVLGMTLRPNISADDRVFLIRTYRTLIAFMHEKEKELPLLDEAKRWKTFARKLDAQCKILTENLQATAALAVGAVAISAHEMALSILEESKGV